MSNPTCATCKHFIYMQGEEGVCKRYPPSAFPMPAQRSRTHA